MNSSVPVFNGERVDPVSGVYHLGNGYRAYNPSLMRFTCPDSMSPFGAGGINPYAYCAGDPINLRDPSGHLSGQAIAGIALGSMGILLAMWTAGSSIAAAGGLAAALNATTVTALVLGGTGVAADVIGIVSDSMEQADPGVSATLGWVSLGLGLASLVGALKIPSIMKDTERALKRFRHDLLGKNVIDQLQTSMALKSDVLWVPELDLSRLRNNTSSSTFRYTPSKGTALLQAHAATNSSDDVLGFSFLSNQIFTTPEELAQRLGRFGDFDHLSRNGYLVLATCFAGRKSGTNNTSLAQRIANAAGINVIASQGEVRVTTPQILASTILSVSADEPFKLFSPKIKDQIRRALL